MELIKLADFTYLSGGCILMGLQCGILTSHLFRIEDDELAKMSLVNLYINLLAEVCIMCVVIFFLTPFLTYFGSPLEGVYGFKRTNNNSVNTGMLLIMAYLIGARNISSKVTEIINKSKIIKIKNENSSVN